MKNKLRKISLIISFVVTLAVFGCYWFRAFENFENQSLDMRFQIRGPQKPVTPIVIAEIDDESLEAIGKWPWPRRIHAQILDVCRKSGAAAVVFDVLFLEPDRYDPGNDASMAQAIKKNGRAVFGFDFKNVEQQVVEQDAQGNAVTSIVRSVEMEVPIPGVAKNSKALGFVNSWTDQDGYLRRGNLTYDYEGQVYGSLNLEAVALLKNQSKEEVLKDISTTHSTAWGNPTEEILVNWRGPEKGTYDSYSCSKILDPNIPTEWKTNWLKGKIVILGSTALGLYDHYPTPFSPTLPGLYYHANLIDNILTKEYLTPVPAFVTIALILLLGLAGGLLVTQATAWVGVVSTFLGIGLYWVIAYFLMTKKLLYIELVAPTISLAGNYVSVFFYRFLVEQREKAGIKKAFGVYVNPHVVDEIAKNPDRLILGGEQREMTVMFSDVAGFTSISENLSPQELVHLLNLYLTAMTETIMKHDGTVDKYEGDAIMAFWGAPLPQPDHARLACLTVLENKDRLKALNLELEKMGLQNLSARCGLNTGPMNVGNMGSAQKFNYTVMGDAVNLASRLEGANKQYSTTLMISESTYEKAKDAVEVRELDLIRVKGKKIPIKVFELAARKNELTDGQKRAFGWYGEGVELYRKRRFKDALKKFQQVNEALPGDGPSATYAGRCKDYIDSPPPKDWDGVYTMTTK